MKKILLLILTGISLLTFGQEFAPLGATWHYSLGSINPGYESFKTIKSISDTTINGIVCKKLVEEENGTSVKTHFVYSKNDSVFFYADEAFHLLYDFNAVAGETIILDYYAQGTTDQEPLKLFVNSVETININGEDRIVQDLTGINELAITFGGKVIQGIGNIHFLFPRLEMSFDGPLRCYEDSFTGLFLNPYYTSSIWNQQDCEQIIMNLNDLELENEIIVYPTPTLNRITIRNITQITEFRILNNNGKTVKNGFVNSSGEIKINELSCGFYFLELKTKEKTIIQKIIKK